MSATKTTISYFRKLFVLMPPLGGVSYLCKACAENQASIWECEPFSFGFCQTITEVYGGALFHYSDTAKSWQL